MSSKFFLRRGGAVELAHVLTPAADSASVAFSIPLWSSRCGATAESLVGTGTGAGASPGLGGKAPANPTHISGDNVNM